MYQGVPDCGLLERLKKKKTLGTENDVRSDRRNDKEIIWFVLEWNLKHDRQGSSSYNKVGEGKPIEGGTEV